MRKKNLDDLIDREIQHEHHYQQNLEKEIYELIVENKRMKEELIKFQQITKILNEKKTDNSISTGFSWRTTLVSFILGFTLGNSILTHRILFGTR